MIETQNEPTVSIALIRILKGYALGLGLDFPAIVSSSGVDPSILSDDRARVSGKQFECMWRQITACSKDPNPGLSFGRELARHYPGGSVVFTMMMNCATVGSALDALVRYHRIMADAVQPQIRLNGDRVHLLWQASHMGFPKHPDLSEALLCIYYLILEHLTQGRLNPIEVRFTHSGTADKGVYRQVFQAPIRFGAKRDELIVAAESLDLDIDLANQELFELLESHAIRIANALGKGNPWTDKVIRRISNMVVKGIKPTLDCVSMQLALSRRSLQAKLNAEQTTFRNCLETVRRQVALDYLTRPEFSVCDIGFLLGYSEQSAFNHAFKRWTGKSPIDFRKETPQISHS